MKLDRCPFSLKKGYDGFSPEAKKKMFDGQKCSPFLPFDSPDASDEGKLLYLENRQRLSVSGYQRKMSLTLENGTLRPVHEGEQGAFLLKPAGNELLMPKEIPANEHLCMLVAEKVFKIPTAPSCLVFFPDGQPAFLCRRFDRDAKGNKILQEDFASLALKTKHTHGDNYKYEGSYEDIARLILQHTAAGPVQLLLFFKTVIYNYLISNGDAHLKNFSLLRSTEGDYRLSPMYDLLCTRIHVPDHDMAMSDGLFEDCFETESYLSYGYFAYDDFVAFGKKIGLKEKIIHRTLKRSLDMCGDVPAWVGQSFMGEKAQELFVKYLTQKKEALSRSYKNRSQS